MTWGNDPCTARLLAAMRSEVKAYEAMAEKDFQRALEKFREGDDLSAQSLRRTGEYMQAVAANTRTWSRMIEQRVQVAAMVIAGETP